MVIISKDIQATTSQKMSFVKQLKQFRAFHKFHNHVYLGLAEIDVEFIHLNNVFMPQFAIELEFSHDLTLPLIIMSSSIVDGIPNAIFHHHQSNLRF